MTRLENVTKRLESVPTKFFAETQEIAIQAQIPSPKQSEPTSLVVEEIEEINNTTINMSVAGYEDIVAGPVRDYLQLSQKIGGDVASHSKLVATAFE